jgi:O-antigen/teichoic acid export membrane protein
VKIKREFEGDGCHLKLRNVCRRCTFWHSQAFRRTALPRITIARLSLTVFCAERKVLFGTLALTAASVLKLGLQVAVLPILARLLGPSAYGLVALALPLIFLATMVSDAGLGNALVRERDSSRELESTIFWCALGTAFALAGLVALLAEPISRLMSEPKLTPILIALTPILPLGGSLAVANARISRERRFGIFAIGETIATLLSLAAGIGAALAGLGVWSLVIQQLLLWSIKVCWLMPASGFRPLAVCKPSLAWPHLNFGLNSVAAGLTDTASKSLQPIIIGALIGIAAVGHYSMAYQIVRVPEMIVGGPICLSIFASVAQWGDDRIGARPLALRALRGLVTLLAPLFCGLGLVADLAVKVLLGPAWDATGPILTLLAPAGFFLCVFAFIGAMLLGLGRSQDQFRLMVLNGCLLAAGTVLGARGGAEGVAAGFSIGAALAAPAYVFVLAKQLSTPVHVIVRDAFYPLVATLAMAVVVSALLYRLPPWDPLLQLTVLVLCGAVSFSLVLGAISGPRLWQDLRWLLRSRGNATAEAP